VGVGGGLLKKTGGFKKFSRPWLRFWVWEKQSPKKISRWQRMPTLGSSSGEIDVNLACGAVWTTQRLKLEPQSQFTQIGTYTIPGITLGGSDSVVDLGGSTVPDCCLFRHIEPHRNCPECYLLQLANGGKPISRSKMAFLTETRQHHFAQACQIAIADRQSESTISNNGSAPCMVSISAMSSFRTGISAHCPGPGSYPLAYDIWIEDNEFVDLGGYGFTQPASITTWLSTINHFQSWGKASLRITRMRSRVRFYWLPRALLSLDWW